MKGSDERGRWDGGCKIRGNKRCGEGMKVGNVPSSRLTQVKWKLSPHERGSKSSQSGSQIVCPLKISLGRTKLHYDTQGHLGAIKRQNSLIPTSESDHSLRLPMGLLLVWQCIWKEIIEMVCIQTPFIQWPWPLDSRKSLPWQSRATTARSFQLKKTIVKSLTVKLFDNCKKFRSSRPHWSNQSILKAVKALTGG